jgi:predicted nucleotidyltransferase/DNA-binding XRE family transcriptional regulator
VEAAGVLLRSARRQAGLSQAVLAERAGVTQSVISAYESGARQPSLPTLARLIAAAGSDLDIRVSPPQSPAQSRGQLAERVHRHKGEVLALLNRFGFTNPRLFGSTARGDERPDSDIDILVDAPDDAGLLTFARCQADLEALLGASVDLVPAGDLKEGVADELLAEAVPL